MKIDRLFSVLVLEGALLTSTACATPPAEGPEDVPGPQGSVGQPGPEEGEAAEPGPPVDTGEAAEVWGTDGECDSTTAECEG